MDIIRTMRYDSPCGSLLLGAYGDRLCLCDWADGAGRGQVIARVLRLLGAELDAGHSQAPCRNEDFACGHSSVLDMASRQLDEYFAGVRKTFDLPLLTAGTDFQKRVWNRISDVPYGRTLSYAGLAARLGSPRAVRAVGAASRANAISIFIPCHRIVGSAGSLTGYAGGLDAKLRLLSLEHGSQLLECGSDVSREADGGL